MILACLKQIRGHSVKTKYFFIEQSNFPNAIEAEDFISLTFSQFSREYGAGFGA